MKLLDLVTHLANRRQNAFFREQGVNTGSEHLSVYMQEAPSLEADIAVLGVEETDEAMDYHHDGTHWVNFLPLYMVGEIIEGGMAAQKSPAEIAARLLDYARNDA